MKNKSSLCPVTAWSLDKLVMIYIRDGLIREPALIGLKEFSVEHLSKSGFEVCGDEDFSLHEKTYRIRNTKTRVTFKVYVEKGIVVSNGISFSEGRIDGFLKTISANLKTNEIYSIKTLLDDSFEYGSLIINDCIDLRFGKLGRYKKRKSFHVLGVSTDVGFTESWSENKISTYGAEIMLNEFNLKFLLQKFRHDSVLCGLFNNIKSLEDVLFT